VVWNQECVVYFVAEFWGAIAAHHRNSEDEDTCFSFVNCTMKGTGSVFLGRACIFCSYINPSRFS